MYSSTTQAIRAKYRGRDVYRYYEPRTGLNVMTDLDGNYISGWQLDDKQIRNLTTTGIRGGGD
jgi:hypothetical protein